MFDFLNSETHLLVPSKKLSIRVERGTALGTGALLAALPLAAPPLPLPASPPSAAAGGGGAAADLEPAWLWNSVSGRTIAGKAVAVAATGLVTWVPGERDRLVRLSRTAGDTAWCGWDMKKEVRTGCWNSVGGMPL